MDDERNIKVEVDISDVDHGFDIGWGVLIAIIVTLIGFYAIVELICKTAKEIWG